MNSKVSQPPLIVGLGGTTRSGSTTERALRKCLEIAAAEGAVVKLLGGDFLAELPTFDPRASEPTAAQIVLIEAMRKADGVIIATPGYHGSISGAVKNALDTLEPLSADARPYLDGRPVGCVVTASGWQAAGTTLVALRSVIHALRGWPTPLGAALNSAVPLFDENDDCLDAANHGQLACVAGQVMAFVSGQRPVL